MNINEAEKYLKELEDYQIWNDILELLLEVHRISASELQKEHRNNERAKKLLELEELLAPCIKKAREHHEANNKPKEIPSRSAIARYLWEVNKEAVKGWNWKGKRWEE